MKHTILLTLALTTAAFSNIQGAQERLPSIEVSPNWITIKSETQKNGRSIPVTIAIRKDIIIAVWEVSMEPDLVESAWSKSPPDPSTIPVDIQIRTNQKPYYFTISGLTAVTAPVTLKHIVAAVEEQNPLPHNKQSNQVEQAGTGQPATRSHSKSEGSDKPQTESEGRSR